MKRLLLALLVSAGLLVAAPGTAVACSCVGGSAASHLRDAEVVVEAAVVRTTHPPLASDLTLLMRVERVYKGGPVPQWTEVSTSSQESACGVAPGSSSTPRVWALYRDGGALSATSCGQPASGPRTAEQLRGPIIRAGLDPAGEEPTAASRPVASYVPGGAPVAWGGAALLLLAGAGVAMLLRRRRG